MDLDNEVYIRITELCNQGDSLLEDSSIDEAIKMYNTALELVPLPKTEWEASTWIYSALGDAYYIKSDFKNSCEFLYNALNCPDGLSNPFILLRLGQSFFERSEFDNAREYLLRAYMLEGYKLFRDEDDRYFELIKDNI
jgi:tetratricopeptide (TPR) repeat protein